MAQSRAAHEKLANARLAAIVASSDDAVVSKTLDGTITSWNPAAERLFGYTAEEVVDRHISILAAPKREHEMSEILERIRRGEKVDHYETIRQRKDGSLIEISLTVSPIRDETGRIIGASKIARDITERKRAERMLRASEECLRSALDRAAKGAQELTLANERLRLEVAERRAVERDREALITDLERKNREMERFCYTISHDLKAPLVTVRGFADLLREDVTQRNLNRLNEDVEEIGRAADDLDRILNELLQLSTHGLIVDAFQRVSLSEVVQHVLRLMSFRIHESNAVVKIASNLPDASGDRSRLMLVFQNLLENSLKYRRHGMSPRIEIGAKKEREQVICYVEDDGRGIDPRYHDRVFGLFDRFQAEDGGRGIGLAIVKRIVEAHKGRIWVESEGENRGCKFTFTLPAAEA